MIALQPWLPLLSLVLLLCTGCCMVQSSSVTIVNDGYSQQESSDADNSESSVGQDLQYDAQQQQQRQQQSFQSEHGGHQQQLTEYDDGYQQKLHSGYHAGHHQQLHSGPDGGHQQQLHHEEPKVSVTENTSSVPVSVLVGVEKPVSYVVQLPVNNPHAVQISNLYPVKVQKIVLPYPVNVPMHYKVPVLVDKPYPSYGENIVRHRSVFTHVPVVKKAQYPVDKPVPYDKPVQIPVHEPADIPVKIEHHHGPQVHEKFTEYDDISFNKHRLKKYHQDSDVVVNGHQHQRRNSTADFNLKHGRSY